MLISAQNPRRSVAASVFQATDRDDTHAIRTAIGKIAGSGQDHQEGGRVHFIGINFFSHRFQAFRALLNEPVAAELNFNEPKREAAANERQDEYEAYVCGGKDSAADAFYETACE